MTTFQATSIDVSRDGPKNQIKVVPSGVAPENGGAQALWVGAGTRHILGTTTTRRFVSLLSKSKKWRMCFLLRNILLNSSSAPQ